jgi:N-acetyl-gamma-glutamylphosphate reductase
VTGGAMAGQAVHGGAMASPVAVESGAAAGQAAVESGAAARVSPETATTMGGAAVPIVVLGGSGYVAGEALRLLAGHPRLVVAGVTSESQAGQPLAEAFPHLASSYPGVRFSGAEDLPRLLELVAEVASGAAGAGRAAALCAAPHGAAAKRVDALLAAAERAGVRLAVVDLSADFRFAAAADYERVYGHPHGAPRRLAQFRCALPEHADLVFGDDDAAGTAGTARAAQTAGAAEPGGVAEPGGAARAAQAAEAAPDPLRHLGHPGCFPTAVLLAAVPLLRLGWIEPSLQVVAVTGSTGAGRAPSPTTHHPARRSNLFAYSPLAHRHEPEMRALAAAAAGEPVEIHFVPQAGPFARGIYATLQARLLHPAWPGREAENAAAVAADLARFYAAAPFVDVALEPPRLQDVVGSNRCRLGVAVSGDRLVAFSAIDNLTKGAAGGGIQWLNRLLGFPETAGLDQPGIGWL